MPRRDDDPPLETDLGAHRRKESSSFQPIVALETVIIRGFELSCAGSIPNAVSISPVFIPIDEETASHPSGMVRRGVSQIRKWQISSAHPLCISASLSPQTFTQPSHKQIRRVLRN